MAIKKVTKGDFPNLTKKELTQLAEQMANKMTNNKTKLDGVETSKYISEGMTFDEFKIGVKSLVEVVSGESTTKAAQKESGKNSEEYLKDTVKKIEDYQSTDEEEVIIPKYEQSEEEKEIVADIEQGGGMQDLEYDNEPSEAFKERQVKAIEGDSTMGNKTYTGKENGNTEPVWGASDAEFGKKLVARTKRRKEKIDAATPNLTSMGGDIEIKGGKANGRGIAYESAKLTEGVWGKIMKGVKSNPQGPFSVVAIEGGKVVDQSIGIKIPDAIPAHYEEIKRNNPTAKISIENGEGLQIFRESAKPTITKLTSKVSLGGLDKAKSMIPEKFKKDGAVVVMTDGNETYKFKWNTEINEAEVLSAENKEEINEATKVFNKLSGFKSSVNENAKTDVKSMLDKAREVINESNLADPNYTHFAIKKDDGKIIEAWNYADEDKEDLKTSKDEYFFYDIEALDLGLSKKDVKIATRQALEKAGIDPTSSDSWYKSN